MNTVRSLIALVPLLLVACASTDPSTKKVVLQQAMDITNVIPFDLASCGPRALTLSPVANDTVAGAVLSAGPMVEECFADPANRDPADAGVTVVATVTVTDADTTVEVEGSGFSAAGKACAESAIRSLPWKTVPQGATGIRSKVPLAVNIPVVKLGENPANDLVGRLRLAQKSACSCYAPVMDKAPPNLAADLAVSPDGAFEVSFPEDGPQAPEVTACLLPIFQKVEVPQLTARLKWPLLLKNSYLAEVDPSAPAALRFQQLEGLRDQLTADVLIATGRRAAAGKAYEAATSAIYGAPNPAKAPREPLKAACAEVVASDEGQRDATQRMVSAMEDSIRFARTEKASSAQFATIEKDLEAAVEPLRAEVKRLEGQLATDQQACASLEKPAAGKKK